MFGLGPVGQFCTRVARPLGAERVFGIDLVPERLEMAARHGVEVIDARQGNVVEQLRERAGGRGADAVVDAVGMEAHGSPVAGLMQRAAGMLPDALAAKVTEKMGVDRLAVVYAAIDAVRRGGTVAISGVYGGAMDPLPMMQLFDKQIQLRLGQANVRRWTDDILPLVLDDGDPLGTADMATHHLPLTEAPAASPCSRRSRTAASRSFFTPEFVVLGTALTGRDLLSFGHRFSFFGFSVSSTARRRPSTRSAYWASRSAGSCTRRTADGWRVAIVARPSKSRT